MTSIVKVPTIPGEFICVPLDDSLAGARRPSQPRVMSEEERNLGNRLLSAVKLQDRKGILEAIDGLKALKGPVMGIDFEDADGNTALIWAVSRRLRDVVEDLLREGANIDKQNNKGQNALIVASIGKPETGNEKQRAEYLDMLRLLVKNDARLNERDEITGKTALMHIAEQGFLDGAAVLVSAGAGIEIEDDKGRTAITLAENNRHTQVAEFLRKASKVLRPESAERGIEE